MTHSRKLVLYAAVLLGLAVLVALPYFATRPLSRDKLMQYKKGQ